MMLDNDWYVLFTRCGNEEKVKKLVKVFFKEDEIKILIPKTKLNERHKGIKVTVVKTVFPGYVLIHMIMTDDSWYIVRNTRGVTGFVGPGSKPVPLTDEEVKDMGISEKPVNVDISVGENIKVKSGPLENFLAVIQEINTEKKKIKALVNMFGRETPVELDFNQIEKIE